MRSNIRYRNYRIEFFRRAQNIEIGCVELLNNFPTGKTWQRYINPERSMPEQAFKIHGLSEEFLHDKPIFSEIIEDFLNFIRDSNLIIHNAI